MHHRYYPSLGIFLFYKRTTRIPALFNLTNTLPTKFATVKATAYRAAMSPRLIINCTRARKQVSDGPMLEHDSAVFCSPAGLRCALGPKTLYLALMDCASAPFQQ